MAANIDPIEAGELDATVQWDFIGMDQGKWHFIIKNGSCKMSPGEIKSPTLTIKSQPNVWVDIINGKCDPQDSLLKGEYVAIGDVSLLLRIQFIFSE